MPPRWVWHSGSTPIHLSFRSSESRIAELDATLRGNFDRNARLEVETALSVLKPFAEQAARGEISMEQAEKAGADLLRQLRYDKEGYFWADTVEGVNVVLLGRATRGRAASTRSTPRASHSSVTSCATGARAVGTPTTTSSRRRGGRISQARLHARVRTFGWVVGAGNYVDDIDALVATERAKAERDRVAQYASIGLVGLVITGLAALVAASSAAP